MWIMIAAICFGTALDSCIPMIWPEPFITEEQCLAAMPGAIQGVPEGTTYGFPRCVENPGQSNT